MPRTALFMGPMARKKVVMETYEPNSYRTISQQAETSFRPKQSGKSAFTVQEDYNILGQMKDVRPSFEFRHNRPNPRHVGFLRQDVRLLNDPVCDVHTASTQSEQYRWWNHNVPKDDSSPAKYTIDTTARGDFQYRGDSLKHSTRHSSNPNATAAHGAVPVTRLKKPDGSQRWLKEGISYEHQYNCRQDPSYPVRGKRHGGFVWDELPSREVDKLMHTYTSENASTPSDKTVNNNCKSPPTEQIQHTAPPIVDTSAMTSVPILPPISAL